MKKRHILLITGLFLLILSFSRFLWMEMLQDVSLSHVKNGQLELQNWDLQENEVLLLDGEWEFYPSTLLFDKDESAPTNEKKKQLINVPDEWNDAFQGNLPTSFGYGSYRLNVFVNPDKDIYYSLYIPSVRSASEVYINGKLVASSGEVGKSKHDYLAKNLPYSTTFRPDEDGMIEIVVQAANFQDIRRSGIIRSLKFGTEEAISQHRNLSFSMQMITFVLLAIHAFYAFALYFLGNRDKRLLFFSLLLLAIALMNMVSSDDKIFHLLFNISYEWDFRLANILGPIASYSLFRCLDKRMIPYFRIVHPIYFALNVGFGIIIIFSSPAQILSLLLVNGIISTLSIVIAVSVIVRKLYVDPINNYLLLFSFLAIVHHLFWLMYWRETGISVVHYPFDYIIAVGLFTLIWFKDYLATHKRTKQLAIKLQQMNEYKDQFLANTSHEFKNPLHGIINLSESVLIREKHLLKDRSIHELETILSVGQRMSLLLNDLLDLTSLKEGSPRLQKRTMMIQPAIQGVLGMLQPTLDAKPITVINQVPADFPAIFADENRIVQILYNLLHNAVKFTDEGHIRISAQTSDKQAYIYISDTGKGMDADFIDRLFLPYEQSTHETMIDSGFGLGLSISKQLIELHGGKLTVSSTPKKGSTFMISFQLASVMEDQGTDNLFDELPNEQTSYSLNEDQLASIKDEVAAIHLPPRSEEINAEQLSVLIVDDDPINLKVLESILSTDKYVIDSVLSGKEALKRLNEKEWALIITDVMMPGMSGYELTTEIRRRYAITELPVLLLTARSEPKDIQTGFLVGANDYVTKPIERTELLARVKALTSLKQSVRQQLHLEAIWLQAQIQPHFLFNTLNSLVALSMTNVEKMSELLIDFSNFLRSKFKFQQTNGLIPIEEELKIVESYVNIEQVRFDQRLEVIWEIDTCRGLKVPFLSIQPLVENAINHGIMKQPNGGRVAIHVSAQEDGVIVSVIDNGVGMDQVTLKGLLQRKTSDHSSVGLINTNQRMIRHFGAGLEIESEVGKGTTVSFTIDHPNES